MLRDPRQDSHRALAFLVYSLIVIVLIVAGIYLLYFFWASAVASSAPVSVNCLG
ncbi:MAG TPA: hypothetical protein VJ397_00220 [Thermoplasmata archaeon]|nr:hypothetical protein [Thermoplasmata archaeon]